MEAVEQAKNWQKKQIKDIVNMFANNYNASPFELWIWLP